MTKWPVKKVNGMLLGLFHCQKWSWIYGGTLQFAATYVDKCRHWSLPPFLKLVFCLGMMRDTRFDNFYSYSVSLFSLLPDYTDVYPRLTKVRWLGRLSLEGLAVLGMLAISLPSSGTTAHGDLKRDTECCFKILSLSSNRYSSVLNWSHLATILNMSFIWIMSFSQIWAMFTIWINR